MGHPSEIDMNKEDNGNIDITIYDSEGLIVAGVYVTDSKVYCQILDGSKTLATESMEK